MRKSKRLKWLNKAIKQHKKVINVFQYRYFAYNDETLEKFKKQVLFKLIDEQKLMEAERAEMLGK